MSDFSSDLRAAADAVAGFGASAADIAVLDHVGLKAAVEAGAELARHTDRFNAWVAAAVAQQSRPELGYDGFAQREGFLSPEALIQSMTGTTRVEAAKLVRVGTMIAETDAAAELAAMEPSMASAPELAPDSGSPDDAASDHAPDAAPAAVPPSGFAAVSWQAPIARAVAAGTLSLDAADAIRKALGDIDDAVTGEQLTAAAETLIADAGRLNADQLFRKARHTRDALDTDGIARREKQRRDLRFFKIWTRQDGMVGGSFLLDPENGATITTAFDTILSPRRGGPRFVDKAGKARAEALLADERSTEQIAADAFVGMVRIAVDADPGTMFGARRPAVRVIVTDTNLQTRSGHGGARHGRIGHGRIEGHPDPISLDTIERHLCDTGTVPVKFDDDGQCINVGRTQRLFTERQRIGMAVRDGGCRFPGCDRPPSWCEAHHIDHWQRDDGNTNIADGVLLCRRHHLLVHNNHWDIIRDHGHYRLKPPASIDPTRTPIDMPSRNPDIHHLQQRKHAG